MAYRLLNYCDQALRLDLRGGDTLLLEAGALSPVLREELLYENVFLERWLEQGLLRRLAASLSEAEQRTGAVVDEIVQDGAPPDMAASAPARSAPARKAPAPKIKNGEADSP